MAYNYYRPEDSKDVIKTVDWQKRLGIKQTGKWDANTQQAYLRYKKTENDIKRLERASLQRKEDDRPVVQYSAELAAENSSGSLKTKSAIPIPAPLPMPAPFPIAPGINKGLDDKAAYSLQKAFERYLAENNPAKKLEQAKAWVDLATALGVVLSKGGRQNKDETKLKGKSDEELRDMYKTGDSALRQKIIAQQKANETRNKQKRQSQKKLPPKKKKIVADINESKDKNKNGKSASTNKAYAAGEKKRIWSGGR